jgi:hypothetical protein
MYLLTQSSPKKSTAPETIIIEWLAMTKVSYLLQVEVAELKGLSRYSKCICESFITELQFILERKTKYLCYIPLVMLLIRKGR